MAIEATRISYSCLPNPSDEESTFEIEQRISNSLEKIKPSNSELKEMYIEVFQAINSLESSSNSCMREELVLGPFLDSLHELLLKILESNPRSKISLHDQLKVLEIELRFVRSLLRDPPIEEYIGPENLNDLMRCIEFLTTELGSLVFSLYTNEMMKDLTKQMSFVMADLQEKVKYIKFKGREIYLNALKPSRSEVPKTGRLSFIQFFLENLEELLSHGDNTIALLKHHIKTIQQEFEFLIPLLKKMERRIN